jgi:alkylated DNA repair dioxygenase AlkB
MICNNKNDTSGDVPNTSPKNNKRCCCQSSNIICIDDDVKGLHVDIHRGLFSSNNHKNSNATTTSNFNINWYNEILNNVQWHRVKYKSNRFQKDCTTPCYTAFYGGRPEYLPYTPIPEWFQPLIDEVTSHHIGKQIKFNAFLLRLYFDGNDEIAWHTDGRTFLGDEPTIASLSLGCRADE